MAESTLAIEPEGSDRPDEPMPELAPIIPLRLETLAGRPPDVSVVDVYEAEHVDLFRFLQAAVHDSSVAEDVLQEAFLRLIRECASGRPPANPRAWLYRVSTNLVISGARRTRTVARTLPTLGRDESDRRSPELVALEVERDEELRIALGAVAPEARAALVLASQGFTAREIGEAVGRSESAVRTLICRARLRLRDRLGLEEQPATDRGAVG